MTNLNYEVNFIETKEQVVIQEPGARGIQGTQIYKGAGEPTNSIGIKSDFYLDSNTNYLYGPKPSDLYWDLSSFVKLQGYSFLTGAGAPDVNLGFTGDTYFDTLTGYLYSKTLNGWVEGVNIVRPPAVSYHFEQQYASKGGRTPADGGSGDGGWYIYHNLDYNPSVIVMDSDKNNIECDIEYKDSNTVILTFNEAIAGHAYLS